MKSARIGYLAAAAFVAGLFWSTPTQAGVARGAIAGALVDRDTRSPLASASVQLDATRAGVRAGTIADSLGRYRLEDVPAGSYVLTVSYVGYEPVVRTDVIVKPDRTTVVDCLLKMAPYLSDAVTVRPDFFSSVGDEPASTVTFGSEEIRRSPGSAGDVSRILSALPSIAKVNDTSNGLVVRGGSTMENGFYLDNIEIPNINHFPSQGASGGPIGLLNVDFLRDVTFHAGGFSPMYGDRLSSITALTFREGNRDGADGQIDLSFAGAGLVGEGPLPGGNGSWLFSARRSYLDLLIGAIGTGVVPEYSDIQGKVVFDLNDRNKLSVLSVSGFDRIESSREQSEEDGNNVYGTYKAIVNVLGMNWQSVWGKSGYSQTSLSFARTKFEWDYQETVSGRDLWRSRTPEQAIQLRNVNSYRFSNAHRVSFGLEAKHITNSYDYSWGSYSDLLGNPTPALTVDDRIQAWKSSAFANYIWQPGKALSVNLGVRAGIFSYNENAVLDPRGSVQWGVTDRTTLSASFGVFHQNLPLSILSQNESNKDLADPVAYHTTIGLSHMLSDETRLTVEAYDKIYRRFPMDPSQPKLFVLDEYTYRGIFYNHGSLVDEGRARSRGLEMVIQKKLAERVYGLVGGSFSTVQYDDLDGVRRDRVHDNRYTLTVEGGYKPNRNWEFSGRWILAGGAPYTPHDIAASTAMNREVIDAARVNDSRYPAYHSLNLRVDRRFHFGGSNIVTYLSVWNAYNRDNTAGYYWNEVENNLDRTSQWSMLPVFGIEYEF